MEAQIPKGTPLVVLAEDAVDNQLPRVVNLNQDPLFSECLVYYFPPVTQALLLFVFISASNFFLFNAVDAERPSL